MDKAVTITENNRLLHQILLSPLDFTPHDFTKACETSFLSPGIYPKGHMAIQGTFPGFQLHASTFVLEGNIELDP